MSQTATNDVPYNLASDFTMMPTLSTVYNYQKFSQKWLMEAFKGR